MFSVKVSCPFDRSHKIDRLRLPYHLEKCKKNYPNSKKIVCPYDATEYIDPENFNEHLKTCAMKATFDIFKTSVKLKNHGDCRPRPYEVDANLVSNEWDSESLDEDESSEFGFDHEERLQRSLAIKKACSYIPEPVKSMGRGERLRCLGKAGMLSNRSNDAYLETNTKLDSSNDFEGRYDDADDDDVSVEVVKTSDNTIVAKNNVKLTNRVSLPNDTLSETVTKMHIEKIKSVMIGRGKNQSTIGQWNTNTQMGRGLSVQSCVPKARNTIAKTLKDLIKTSCSENELPEQHPSKNNCIEKQTIEQHPSESNIGQNQCPNTATSDSWERHYESIGFSKPQSRTSNILKLYNLVDKEINNSFNKYHSNKRPSFT